MNKNNPDVGSWILTVVMLMVFPPVGIFLLFRQLMGYGKSSSTTTRQRQHPYDIERDRQRQSAQNQYNYNYQYEYHYDRDDLKTTQKTTQQAAPAKPKAAKAPPPNAAQLNLGHGKVMTLVGGIISAVFGMNFISELLDYWSWGGLGYAWSELIWLLGFCVAGLVVLYAGLSRTKKGRRFAKYLSLIGKQKSVSVPTLSSALGRSTRKVCDDLDEMLERGLLPTGYLDRGSGLLILSDEGVREAPKPQEKTPEEEVKEDNAILREIREVNEAIPDPTMSRKIDRIEEITGKILDYQRKNPGKDVELRSFLDYYLPTTLKILRAYAQLDAQGIQGENISSAKERIEGMMDKVVEGFEKQLDKLFQSDTLDIASDVQVLEQMLQKDGLSGGEGMTLEL